MFRRVLLLALMTAGIGWVWTRYWRPAHNYLRLSGRLESALNQDLAEQGITDQNIAYQVRKGRSRWGMVWIETERRIDWTPKAPLEPLLIRLRGEAERLGCSVTRRNEGRIGVAFEVRKGPCLLQRLVFASGKKGPARVDQVAFVIDDVAYDLDTMDRYAALRIPLTFAILPRDKKSRALADKAYREHFAVILHLPMEPLDRAHNDPGPSGLYLNMTPEQLRIQFDKNVASVPHIQGINNHMGSAFTEDEAKMTLVLQWVKERHLFFLDSRTSLHSVVPRVARAVGVPCLVNQAFLDNADDTAAIEKELDQLLAQTLRNHRGIAIGHYRRKHLTEALAQKIPEFRARGVQIVTLPTLYQR